MRVRVRVGGSRKLPGSMSSHYVSFVAQVLGDVHSAVKFILGETGSFFPAVGGWEVRMFCCYFLGLRVWRGKLQNARALVFGSVSV